MNLKNFISELKRRNVFRVATAYAIAGWLIIQVVTAVEEPLSLPEWFDTSIIILVAIGLPIALIIAWAFELTPEGLKKSHQVQQEESITPQTGQKLNRIIISSLALLVLFLLAERFLFNGSRMIEDQQIPVSAIADKSIAVLPFDDFNAGGEQEYFADGLTEEILNVLVRTPDLQVASRTSSFQYKDQNMDITKVASDLGVAHVLEGSVRQSSSRIRVTAQLIRASDGFHLWSENYDRQPEDIIEVQEDIAFKIASALETAMDPEALEEMVKAGTNSVEAYNAYLKALTFNFNNNEEGYELFEQARSLDPSFAEAHFRAADFWRTQLFITNMGSGRTEYTYTERLEALRERLDAAIQNADEVSRLKYRAVQAEVNLQFRKAFDLMKEYYDLRPGNTEDVLGIINYASNLGEKEIALQYTRKLEEISLKNPEAYSQIILSYLMSRSVEDAVRVSREAAAAFPYADDMLYQAHRALLWGGHFAEAGDMMSGITGEEIGQNNLQMIYIRQACADNNAREAQLIYSDKINTLPDEAINLKWLSLKLLGEDQQAYELLKPLDQNDQLLSLSSWLFYPYFDISQFPNLNRIMMREEAKRGDTVKIPFACKR